jgi:hypothetical protein
MTTATAVGHVEMRIAKVVGLGAAEDEPVRQYVVLEEVAGGRHLAIAIGQPEAFTLAAHLGGIAWPRPMTYQFVARLSASPWRARPAGPDRSRDGGNLHRHRQGGRPARGCSRRRATQRRPEPHGAGPGTDLRRHRGAARSGSQMPG